MFTWLRGLKKLAAENFFTKISGVFIAGSMSHKMAIVIGIAGLVIGFWQFLMNAFVPLLIAIAGLIIIQIAIKDHEALKQQDTEETKSAATSNDEPR